MCELVSFRGAHSRKEGKMCITENAAKTKAVTFTEYEFDHTIEVYYSMYISPCAFITVPVIFILFL